MKPFSYLSTDIAGRNSVLCFLQFYLILIEFIYDSLSGFFLLNDSVASFLNQPHKFFEFTCLLIHNLWIFRHKITISSKFWI